MIKYSISKHNQLSELNGKDIYILWKEITSDHGFAVKGIFKGTKKECQEYLEKIKGE